MVPSAPSRPPTEAPPRRIEGWQARRRGRRPTSELAEVKALLGKLTARVLGEEGTVPLETGPAAVANQLINTRLRAIELERKIRELDDLEALEGVLKPRRAG